MVDGDTWEYPLWALTANHLTFEHVQVENPGARLDLPSTPRYCLVVTLAPTISSVEVQGKVYRKVLDAGPLALWQ